MNRLGRCILGFGFLCSSLLFSVSASAASVGETIIDDSGCFTITVTDDVNQYGSMTEYTGIGGKVEIPEMIEGVTITEIGDDVFRSNKSITEIVIPNTVVNIGDYAFDNCENLENVNLGDSLQNIGANSFSSCKLLTKLTFPASLTHIGKNAFSDCDKISSVYILGSGVQFETFVFDSSIKDMDISVPNRSDYASQLANSNEPGHISLHGRFFHCRHESGTLGCCDAHSSHVYEDGDECIYCGAPVWEIDGNKLVRYNGSEETVVVPENITVLGSLCFDGCSAKSILLPNGLLTIESGVFSELNSLENIVIPDSCTTLGLGNFCNCDSLEKVILSDNITQIFPGCFGSLPQLNNVVLPEKLESIGSGNFSSCGSLKEIVLPKSLTAIPMGLFNKTPLERIYVSSTEFFVLEHLELPSSITVSVPNKNKFYEINPTFDNSNSSATVTCRHEERGCCDEHMECIYDKDGFCEICKQAQEVVFLRGASLSLTGEVEVSIYLQYAGPFLENMDQVSVSISRLSDENKEVETLEYNAAQGKLVQSGDQTYYVYDYSVPVKNMTSQIVINISDGKQRNISYSYSVWEYADHLLDLAKEDTNYAKYVGVTKAMLNYGAAAQEYFNYDTSNLANKSLSDADKAVSSEETVKASVANCERKISGDLPEGISFYASTMVFYGKPIIRQYFKIADGVNPADYGLVSGANNLYYKDTLPLSIKDIGNNSACVVTVGDCSITFSPLAYINAMLNSASSSQVNKNLCCALYDFYMANVEMQL